MKKLLLELATLITAAQLRPRRCAIEAHRVGAPPTLLALAILVGTIASLVSAPAAGARTPRLPGTDPSTCDGIANYADELAPFKYRLVRQTVVEDGLTEIEIALDLRKRVGVPFRAASVQPDLTSLAPGGAHGDLGVQLESLLPAEFPAIDITQRSVSSSEPLVLRLPTENVSELRRRLMSRRLPMTVHADEERVLQPGIRLEAWSDAAVNAFTLGLDAQAAGNRDAVEAQPPYAPDAEYVIELAHRSIDHPLDAFFTSIDPAERVFLIPGDDPLGDLPEVIHYVEVVEAVFDDSYLIAPGQLGTAWYVRVRRTDLESIPDIYESGSFCTPPSSHIDWPVQATRLHQIDGDVREDAERDSFSQPIRFNDIPFAGGAVTLSGQVQGHVLEPTLEIRVRKGGVRATADIDTDLSLSAELRAHVSETVSETVSLYDLCFPLASLPVGPISIALNLQLQHDLQVDGSIAAGAVVGFQKRFEAGYTMGYDERRRGDPWFAEPRHAEPHPVEFTPPRLTDDTAAHVSVYSDARVIIRVGAEYPLCDTGFGAFLNARGFGTLDVTPTEEDWWQVGHGVELVAGMDIQAYGLEIVDRETEPLLLVGEDVRVPELPSSEESARSDGDSMAFLAASRSEGADQRWAVGIDDPRLIEGINATSLAELSDGSMAAVAHETVGRNYLLKLDRFGQLLWRREYAAASGYAPQRLAVLPDDSIVVAGASGFLARHDANGALLWANRYEVQPGGSTFIYCAPTDVIHVEAGGGGLVLVGNTVFDPEPDACAFRVDLDGNVVWARTYENAGNQYLLAATPVTVADGNGGVSVRIAAAGRTESGPSPFERMNPLVVMLEAEEGILLWAHLLADYGRFGRFEGIVQGEDGALYMAGASQRGVSANGAALVARIDADSTDARAALVLQDEEWERLLDFEVFQDTQGGDTAIDVFLGITTAPGGIVVAGSTGGLLSVPSGAWVARLNPGLGIEWFTTIDGAGPDVLESIVRTRDGFLAAGWSDSLEGVGQEPNDRWLTILKLPFEGRVEFAAETLLTSRYVEPGIRFVSENSSLSPGSLEVIPEPLTASEATVSVTAIADPLIEPRDLCVTPIAGVRAGDAPACTMEAGVAGDEVSTSD